jgi:hypothetical protein
MAGVSGTVANLINLIHCSQCIVTYHMNEENNSQITQITCKTRAATAHHPLVRGEGTLSCGRPEAGVKGWTLQTGYGLWHSTNKHDVQDEDLF